MKIELNSQFNAVICESTDQGAMNAFTFEADNSWAIEIDNGQRYSERYHYTTEFAQNKKMYFNCGNAKAAIQQAIITALAQRSQKLSEIYFRIEPKQQA